VLVVHGELADWDLEDPLVDGYAALVGTAGFPKREEVVSDGTVRLGCGEELTE